MSASTISSPIAAPVIRTSVRRRAEMSEARITLATLPLIANSVAATRSIA